MIIFIEIFISSLFIWLAAYLIGTILFQKYKIKTAKALLLSIIFSIIIVLLNISSKGNFYGVVKILTVYILECVFYREVFEKPMYKSMTAALIYYLCMFISEIIVALVLSLAVSISGMSLVIFQNTIFINWLITSIAYVLAKLNNRRLAQFIKSVNSNPNDFVIISIIILITLALIVFNIPIDNWKFNTEFVATMMVLMFCCIIGLYLLTQRSEIEKTTSMYQQVVRYSNTTNKVLEDYRMISHEHKNQLSIIRHMISKDNIEILDYIDSLINKRNDIKYKWVAELNKLPLDGLKGLINYKLIEAEENSIKTSVIISKDVSKVKLNSFSTMEKDHLYSIVGVYLDNAIQAACKCKVKEMSIEIYRENKTLFIIIANTYKGKMDFDKLDDYGYSTKGKNRGIGLHIVKVIMNEDKLYSQSRKIIDNYYVQELRINISELNKKKK